MIVGMEQNPRGGVWTRCWAVATALLCLTSLTAFYQLAQADPAPAKGVFLVASEDLMDPNFYRTVILLISYGREDGAMGLVINRPTAILPRRILPDVEGLSRYNGPIYFGGPVMLDHIVFLWRNGVGDAEGELIFGGVRLSDSRELLDAVAEESTDPSTLRIYAGYAGWAPGQLEFELIHGGWRVASASEAMVFADEPGGIWDRLRPMPEPLSAALLP